MHIQPNHPKKLKKGLLVAHRLVFLWAGVFRDKLAISLTIFYQRIIARIHQSEKQGQEGALISGDRQFSFGESPMIYIKMHRPASSYRFKLPNISCVRFEFESEEEEEGVCDEGIDLKAEEFIAKFHEQMRLQQSQMSCLHYLQ